MALAVSIADYAMRGRRHLPSLSFRFAAVVGSLPCGSGTLASRFDPSSSVPARRTAPATAHTYKCLYGQLLCAGLSLRALPRRPCRFGATPTFCGSPFHCGRRLTPMWLWHASFRVPRGFLQFFWPRPIRAIGSVAARTSRARPPNRLECLIHSCRPVSAARRLA